MNNIYIYINYKVFKFNIIKIEFRIIELSNECFRLELTMFKLPLILAISGIITVEAVAEIIV